MKAQIPEKKISKTEPIRPFCLEYADAKAEVFATINAAMQKHNVPLFLMENILTEALHQVREGAKAEIQNATDSYQKQMDEFNKTTE